MAEGRTQRRLAVGTKTGSDRQAIRQIGIVIKNARHLAGLERAGLIHRQRKPRRGRRDGQRFVHHRFRHGEHRQPGAGSQRSDRTQGRLARQ